MARATLCDLHTRARSRLCAPAYLSYDTRREVSSSVHSSQFCPDTTKDGKRAVGSPVRFGKWRGPVVYLRHRHTKQARRAAMAKEVVGFIGLGIMGSHMAGHILRAGYEMVVYNRTRAKMEPAVQQGAKPAHSYSELAARCDVVITMLADSQAVEQVYLGPRCPTDPFEGGVLAAVHAGALLIDMST
ncbi:MAG: hypothetical protein FJ026_12255, partial [Chloroflexi bacterium]|nr:hypothetical protein [Chloroflexota bacterium]